MTNAIDTTRQLRIATIVGLLAVVAIAVSTLFPTVASAAFGGWEFQPYRVRAMLALDVPGGLAEQWAVELPEYLQNRVDSAFAPAWRFTIELASGAARAKVFREIDAAATEKPIDLGKDTDKLILLSARWTPLGLKLSAREYDAYVERWSVPIHRECRQNTAVPEQLFALLGQAFSPLAQLDPDPNDPKRATLRPRGSVILEQMTRTADAPPWAKAGDVFLPLTRRTARGGQVVENGIQPVPWTYVEAVEGKDKALEFHVLSGNRRPFTARRSSRLEQLAVGVRADADTTTLKFYPRKNEKKPLVGYEVLTQNPGEETATRIGLSDAAGEIQIPPGKRRIENLVIKHGGQLLAKLPLVPGAEQAIKVPLPDDDARLAAEAGLAAVREDLIDIVARRKILMARARQRIEKKDYAGAEELLRTLDDLPAKPQFKLKLDTSARLLRSDDPAMQRKIDALFSQTQTLMTQFLDIKPISQIHNELREAQQKSPPKAGKS